MKIAVIGAGYVGLTTAVCLAQQDNAVRVYDIDSSRLEKLATGKLPIFEPGLEKATRSALMRGALKFSSSVEECVRSADIVFLTVGTPPLADGQIDLSFIRSAARQIALPLKPATVVVIKSTVTAGTCRKIADLIARKRKAADITVASNPEFLREGSAMADFLNPDRIVVGADDPRTAAILAKLYRPITLRGVRLLSTSTRNAELIKYAANAFLALKIGFINDVAELCEHMDGDIAEVAEGIGLDKRIGHSFLAPGPGFGGSCFPKDTRAFAMTGRQNGAPQRLIETLIAQNDERKARLASRILNAGSLSGGGKVAVLGLAFKANTDDVRESPALAIIPHLQKAGVRVRAHDPKAIANARDLLSDVDWLDCPYEAARGAQAVVILTEWDDYRCLQLRRLARLMSGSTLFDFRNLFDPAEVAEHGLRYVGIGRPAAASRRRLKSRAGGHMVAPLDKSAAAIWQS